MSLLKLKTPVALCLSRVAGSNMIKIENKSKYKGPGEYIGRPNILGNPFTHRSNSKTLAKYVVASVGDAIERYELHLESEMNVDGPIRRALIRLAKIYQATGELTLICWCAPKPCHGQIVSAMVLRIIAEKPEWLTN